MPYFEKINFDGFREFWTMPQNVLDKQFSSIFYGIIIQNQHWKKKVERTNRGNKSLQIIPNEPCDIFQFSKISIRENIT